MGQPARALLQKQVVVLGSWGLRLSEWDRVSEVKSHQWTITGGQSFLEDPPRLRLWMDATGVSTVLRLHGRAVNSGCNQARIAVTSDRQLVNKAKNASRRAAPRVAVPALR